ncbi:hypothetical protein GUI12_01785 [Anaplasmataceae bacterium AB001_6]|nr:hypothetical protein GUI12_01785 [Anaplasmataceae bacterium AB001_6]
MNKNKILSSVKEAGWSISILLKNVSEESQYKYAVKFELPRGVHIIGSIWGGNSWASEISINYHNEENTYIIHFDFTKNSEYHDYSLKACESRIFSFSHDSSTSLNISDIQNIQAFTEEELQTDLSLEIFSPAKPLDLSGNNNFEVILTKSNTQKDYMYLDWNSSILLENIQSNTYQVDLNPIETAENIYFPTENRISVDINDHNKKGRIVCEYDYENNKYPLVKASFNLAKDENDFNYNDDKLNIQVTSRDALQKYGYESFDIKYGENVLKTLVADNEYMISSNKYCINNTIYSIKKISEIILTKENNHVNLLLDHQIADNTKYSSITIKINSDVSLDNLMLIMTKVKESNEEETIYRITNLTTLTKKQNFIKPGIYKIDMHPHTQDGIIFNSVLVNHDSNNVEFQELSDLTLEFNITTSQTKRVKGWPDRLAFGGVTNNASYVSDKYKTTKCPIDALFKYAGINGGGDRGLVLNPLTLPTHDTIRQCSDLSEYQDSKIMPVMVIYTCELSGGISDYDFEINNLKKHYMNLLSECCVAQSYKNNSNLNPATFIINPDFLGMIQQNTAYNSTIQNWFKKGSISVNETLQAALLNHDYQNTLIDYYNYIKPAESDIPMFTDDIYGYIASLNWLIKQYSPDVPFGWQINVWQTGSAYWVYDNENIAAEIGNKVISFLKEMQVYEGNYAPDFIVFDKYERDEFGSDALPSYAWSATHWKRYVEFTKVVSDGINTPSMLWQIPGSHAPTIEDGDEIIISQHAGSGGMFFLGDARIGTDINKIHHKLLDIFLRNYPAPYKAENIRGLFLNDNGYDWSQNQLNNAIEANAFSILWGGGSTTSVVSINQGSDDWLLNKIKEYYNK